MGHLDYNVRKILVGIFLLLGTFSASSMPNVLCKGTVDDEYEQFRKQGDEFFSAGQYKKAVNKFLSCLEVPGFEKDNYVLGQLEICKRILELQSDIFRKSDINLLEQAMGSVNELLKLNPEDMKIRNVVFTFWSNKGIQAMDVKKWQEALDSFTKASIYKKDTSIERKIKRCENMLVEVKEGSAPSVSGQEIDKDRFFRRIGIGL